VKRKANKKVNFCFVFSSRRHAHSPPQRNFEKKREEKAAKQQDKRRGEREKKISRLFFTFAHIFVSLSVSTLAFLPMMRTKEGKRHRGGRKRKVPNRGRQQSEQETQKKRQTDRQRWRERERESYWVGRGALGFLSRAHHPPFFPPPP
jgi:hypothetical protein